MKTTWSFPGLWGLPGGGVEGQLCSSVTSGRGARDRGPRELCAGVAFELDKGWEVLGLVELGRPCSP